MTFARRLTLFRRPLGGVIGCVVLTFVLRLQAFNTSHYAAFHLENILRSRLARKALQLPRRVTANGQRVSGESDAG